VNFPPILGKYKKMYDTHCHLNDDIMLQDIDTILSAAARVGVDKIVVPAWDFKSSKVSIDLAKRYNGTIFASGGLHPFYVREDDDFSEFEDMAKTGDLCAIGEIGIDSHYKTEMKWQERAFKEQLDIAQKYELPVLLHSNRGYDRFFDILKDFIGIKGVMHGFTAGKEVLSRGLDMGLYVAFNGLITREKTRRAKEAASFAPLDRILLETDAPYITVEGVPQTMCRPEHLLSVAESLAAIKDISLQTVQEVTTKNSTMLF